MHLSRRSSLFLTLSFAIALIMSLGLLQLSQASVQSAPADAPVVPGETFEFSLTKLVDGAAPADDWEFTIENTGFFTSVQIPGSGGQVTVTLPGGTYTITEVPKEGYMLIGVICSIVQSESTGPIPYSHEVTIVEDGESCQFHNSQLGKITIIKDAVSDSSQPFTLTVDPVQGNDDVVVLVDDGSGLSNTVELYYPYAATIQEDQESMFYADWVSVDIGCVDSSGAVTGTVFSDAASVTIDSIVQSEHYTCTFTNSTPSLVLTKTVGTDPNVCATTDEIDVLTGTEVYYCYGIANQSALTLTQNALFDDELGQIGPMPSELNPYLVTNSVEHSYVISKVADLSITNVATWTAVYTGLVAGEVPVRIPVTATASARVNAYDPSQIVVKKVTMPTDDEQEFGFMLAEEGGSSTPFTVTSASDYESPLLLPGVYSVTEQLIEEGWMTVGEPTCSDDTGRYYDASDIQLSQGVTVTCTFTNAKQARIYVDKVTDPATTDIYFDFTISGDAYTDTFSLADNTPIYGSEWLMPDTYSVSEADKDQWTLEYVECTGQESPDALLLSYGSVVNCIFNNKSTPTALDDIDYPDLEMQQLLPFMGASE